MMRVLAIDTSTRWCSVALLDRHEGAARLVAELGARVDESHAAQALPLVDRLLAAAAWPKSSLDAYVAVRGPGSFTGVRVALGLMRGLAIAAGRPCVGVGTLDAMAEASGPAAADRVPLLDAGRGEVYGARFDAAASPPRAIVPAWVGEPERALAEGADVCLFGGGAAAHERRLRDAGYRGAIGSAPTGLAAGAGRIALARFALGNETEFDGTPLYVRPSDAEVRVR
jgi:tRNA threonylcarbamoyladenosine biosynthesis protein TsaB